MDDLRAGGRFVAVAGAAVYSVFPAV